MHVRLFGKTLYSWVAQWLKVSRSGYMLNKRGWLDDARHWQWHHPTHGLAQRSLVARWWFIHGLQWLYNLVYHYAMDNGLWMHEHEGANVSESTHYVPWLGTVEIIGCNVLDHQHIMFALFHYEFNIHVDTDRPFPEKPMITNVFKQAKEKEEYAW